MVLTRSLIGNSSTQSSTINRFTVVAAYTTATITQRNKIRNICCDRRNCSNAVPNVVTFMSHQRFLSQRKSLCIIYRRHSSYSYDYDRTGIYQYSIFRYQTPQLSGLECSAMKYESDENDEMDDRRPHPPPLSDEISYGDGYGANQYDSTYDIYDQAEIRKGIALNDYNGRLSSKYDATEDRQTSRKRQLNAPLVTKNSARPPVQVSIPSLRDTKETTPELSNIDLSRYDTNFDSHRSNDITPAAASSKINETTVRDLIYNTAASNKSKGQVLKSSVQQSPQTSLIPPTHFHVGQSLTELPGYDPALDHFLSAAAYGVGTTTSIDVLREELATTERTIYEYNNHQTFNINSPKQVAIALFGPKGDSSSTNKDVLEGMAGGGNRLAALILQYRSIKYKLAKFVRQDESRKKGTAVRSALTVARPTKEIADNKILSTKKLSKASNASLQVTEAPKRVLRDVIADPLLLLDASAYIFRAYYSMPPIHRPDGMPTGAVMGFCKMLNSLLLNRMLEGEQPRLVLCFDAKGKTFRHDLSDDYKANRPAAPMDLVPQFELVRQAAKAYGICQIEAIRFEADDVIATLACKAIEEGVDANIMSGDKDLMQLVTDLNVTPSIQIIDPMKKERTTYQEVLEKWQVPPNRLGDLLALAGDTADNVPGVKGIGPKTAAKLINDFGTLDNLLNNIDSVKQQSVREKLYKDKANARLSRTLVELNCTVPMNELLGLPDGEHQKISDLRMEAIDPDRIIAFYDQMGFKELKRSFQNSLKGLKVKRKKGSTSNKRPKATIPTPDDYKDVPF
jgi:5'-3' exonuclease